MMSVLGGKLLTEQQEEKRIAVIKIFAEFLRTPTGKESHKTVWDRELSGNRFSWLGWTMLTGDARAIIAVIESQQSFDPLICTLFFYVISK